MSCYECGQCRNRYPAKPEFRKCAPCANANCTTNGREPDFTVEAARSLFDHARHDQHYAALTAIREQRGYCTPEELVADMTVDEVIAESRKRRMGPEITELEQRLEEAA